MTTNPHLTEPNENNQGQSRQVVEIFDPEIAMCLESKGLQRTALRNERGLEIFSYHLTRALSDALQACDPYYDEAIWSIRDAEVDQTDDPDQQADKNHRDSDPANRSASNERE